jgi:hypothetical protein
VLYRVVTFAGLIALAFVSDTALAADPPVRPVPAYDQSAIARRGFFYVDGGYVGGPGKQLMHEQIYVEALTPRHPRSRYPLVLIHGAAQTATNWMGTPDGRPGRADFFVGQGYTVYMVDQPARGRSPWLPEVDGKLATFTAGRIESRFTARQARQKFRFPPVYREDVEDFHARVRANERQPLRRRAVGVELAIRFASVGSRDNRSVVRDGLCERRQRGRDRGQRQQAGKDPIFQHSGR